MFVKDRHEVWVKKTYLQGVSGQQRYKYMLTVQLFSNTGVSNITNRQVHNSLKWIAKTLISLMHGPC